MTKRRIRNLGIAVLAVIGLAVLLYPIISDKWNGYRQQLLLSDYSDTVQKIDKTEQEALLDKAKIYNAELIGSEVPDIFVRMENTNDLEYDSILNPSGDGVMGSVEIPCIDVNLPIYHSTSDKVLQMGAGHLPGSSLPVGGEGTHAVISAHRGLPTARMFTDLDRVKEGDQFYLHILGETLAYEVDKSQVVDPDETESLAIDQKKDYVTLVTCTPYGINTQRLLVRGHRVDYHPEERVQQASHKAPPTGHSVAMRLLCVLAGLILGGAVIFVPGLIRKGFRRSQKRRESR